MADLSVGATNKQNFVLLPSGKIVDTGTIVSVSTDSIWKNKYINGCEVETNQKTSSNNGIRDYSKEDCAALRKELLK